MTDKTQAMDRLIAQDADLIDLPAMTDVETIAPSRLHLPERILAGQIKALSVKQPYPHHIFHDGKDVENRDWPTKGRGWFIIHAGVSTSECADRQKSLPRGGIVGMARIVDCVTEMDSRWFLGKHGFVLRDAFPVELIPCKGQLGFFMPPRNALEALALAVRNHLKGLPNDQ
jgi:hypothetical protein